MTAARPKEERAADFFLRLGLRWITDSIRGFDHRKVSINPKD